MSGPDYDSRDIVIRAVTPQQIADARSHVSRQLDAADLLDALGIGPTIQILTTEDVA